MVDFRSVEDTSEDRDSKPNRTKHRLGRGHVGHSRRIGREAIEFNDPLIDDPIDSPGGQRFQVRTLTFNAQARHPVRCAA